MKEKIIKTSYEDIEIPEIVNQKCSEAYNKILSETINSKYGKRFNKKYFAVICTAAVLAVGITVLVMAEYIPALRNAYEAFTNNIYTKSPQRKNNLTEYADNIGLYHQGEYADITIDDVYFDGNDISFSYALSTSDSELKKSTGIDVVAEVYLDGNLLENISLIGFSAVDDGNYYGVSSSNVSEYNINDTAELYIKLYSFEGRDAYTWVADEETYSENNGVYMPEYKPMTTKKFDEIYEFKCNVTPDSTLVKNYPVNKTKDGITLESIDVSPFRTTLNIKGVSDEQSIRVKDNNGNEYEPVLDTGEMLLWDGSGWEAPLKDASFLTIEIFKLDEEDFPVEASFTVQIEKGYREKYNVECNDDKEITYIPPMEEAEEQYNESHETKLDKVRASVLENGEILEVNEKMYSDEYGINIAVTGSEIVYDFSGYELTDVGKLELSLIEENNDEELALYLVDYEISNPSDEEKSFYFAGNNLYDENLNYAMLAGEPTYLSVKDNFGHDGYIYDIAANETRNITVGFIVSKETAENITYVIPDNSLTGDYDFESIITNIEYNGGKLEDYTDGYILMKVK